MNEEAFPIAIDLGTTNSVVHVYKNGQFMTVPNNSREGSNLFPSFVEYMYVKEGGKIVQKTNVGYAAKNNFDRHLRFVVGAPKRIIGLNYAEYEEKVQKKEIDPTVFGCQVVEKDGEPYFVTSRDGKLVHPIDVVAKLFEVLKSETDKFTGTNNKEIFLTVPVNYTNRQCCAIEQAAKQVGFVVRCMIREPIAAAMSWFLNNTINNAENILVFDFGGGTFDVTHVQCDLNHGKTEFRIINSHGDPLLGGNDIDTRLMEYIWKTSLEQNMIDIDRPEYTKYDLANLPRIRRNKLRSECERVKMILTNQAVYYDDKDEYERMNSNVYQIIDMNDYDKAFDNEIVFSASMLNYICENFVVRVVNVTEELMQKGRINRGNIKYFLVVGGSSHIHRIRQELHRNFPNAMFPDVNSYEAISLGAYKYMIQSYEDIHQGELSISIQDRIFHSYGIDNGQGVTLMIKKGEMVPILNRSFVEEPNEEDNSDEIVLPIYKYVSPNNDEAVPDEVEINACEKLSECVVKKPYKGVAIEFKMSVYGGGFLEIIIADKEKKEILDRFIIKGVY